MRHLCLASMIGLALNMSGCASLTHYKSDLGDPKLGVSVDIKQRMVLRNTPLQPPSGAASATSTTSDGKKEEVWPRICAEPSPDAISALGGTLGAGLLMSDTKKAQITATIAESSAYVGLRTQSIQLMRDAMYRACEAYMSGAIAPDDYIFFQRRFQAQVVGLLAIEQLTSPLVAPPVTVHTTANIAQGGNLDAAADRVTTAQRQLSESTTALVDAKKQLNAAQLKVNTLAADAKMADEKDDADSSTEKPEANAALIDAQLARDDHEQAVALAQQEVKLRKDTLSIAQDAYQSTKDQVRASSSGDAQVPARITARHAMNPTALATVAGTVKYIVDKVLNGAFDDQLDICLRKVLNSVDDTKINALSKVCIAIASKSIDTIKAHETAETEPKARHAPKKSAATSTKKPAAADSRVDNLNRLIETLQTIPSPAK